MGDGLKINKDKRHRSSSSLAGAVLEGTRSERKLDIRASIPEVEDQFALAEARCDDLQEKIDLVKVLKRKRKLKKKSMTRVTDSPIVEAVPFITVRTQPKKKVSQQNARTRRLELPNPVRGYLDPATVEQHRMLGHMRSFTNGYKPREEQSNDYAHVQKPHKTRMALTRAEGDGMCGQGVQISTPLEVGCGQDELDGELTDSDFGLNDHFSTVNHSKAQARHQLKTPTRRKHVSREVPKEVPQWMEEPLEQSKPGPRGVTSPACRRRPTSNRQQQSIVEEIPEERPVVELFNKSRSSNSPNLPRQTNQTADKRTKKVVRETPQFEDQATGPLDDLTQPEAKKHFRHPRRVKYRTHRYELPTVASQMKQAGMRYYYGNANHSNIPFVVSKSTAPSHNIGVNIQQVLNGLKIQQPLSGIPLTIAHHMGLGHISSYGTKSATAQCECKLQNVEAVLLRANFAKVLLLLLVVLNSFSTTQGQNMSLDNREINVIKLGPRMLRLPSYKYMSYNRLLNLYREGDGMVPRFLRAISRPHYFYTSMYNLATNHEDFDGATSKGRGGSQEAKQSLAEYASLYREYEKVDKCLQDGNYDPELERRREELSRELAAREEHIRKVVQDYRTPGDAEPPLRASASTAEDAYRHSTYKLNVGDQ